MLDRKELEHRVHEERLRDLDFFSQEKIRLRKFLLLSAST